MALVPGWWAVDATGSFACLLAANSERCHAGAHRRDIIRANAATGAPPGQDGDREHQQSAADCRGKLRTTGSEIE